MSTAIVDPAFHGAGKREGLALWRVEKTVMVRQPKVDGKFHEGDCYVLLSTRRSGTGFSYSTHFWIGKESSQDEQGIAAYKTVELDDSLGGSAAQYRESQGQESPLFLSYFKSTGVEYKPGGVESGFNKMEKDQFDTRLLHVKGKRVVRTSEVPCTVDSLNTGDVFILDAGLKLFLWSGESANMYEKSKGVQMMQRIKDNDRAGRATMEFMEDDPTNEEFWGALGGFTEITAEGESDEVVERLPPDAIKLYQVSDESGDMVTRQVEPVDGKLTGDMLGTDDVYILDVGSELFVWVGRGSSVEEKKSGFPYAARFIEETGRNVAMPVSRLSQGYETLNFKGYFAEWNPVPVPSWDDVPPTSRSPGLVSHPEVPAVDAAAIAAGMQDSTEAEDDQVDDGSGKLEIWRVENFQLKRWPQEKYGQLYGGDCYVMLYTYLVNEREMYIIYFWQGRTSSKDEIGASAILAKEMDNELDGAAVQVRVVQGKEPKHMRSLFKGRLVIHSGGVASGFRNSEEEDSYDVDGVCLYHVKGTCPDNTYAVQVPESASNLNSGDSFVLLTPSDAYTWIGRSCAEEEVAVAEGITEMLLTHGDVPERTPSTVAEGSETDEFWEALGGKADYPETSKGEVAGREPRLFQVSNMTGALTANQVCNFDQSDLCADDIMLLDTFVSVFVWVGQAANETERTAAMSVAEEYIKTSSDGRSLDTPVLLVTAGCEPPMFTQHFRGWDASIAGKDNFVDPYEAKLAEAKEAKEKAEEEAEETPGTITMEDIPAPEEEQEVEEAETPEPVADGLTVPYDELKGYGKEIPGVDPSCREQYLSNQEFRELFGMSKSEFATQPKWRQVAAKKEKELF